MQKTAEFIGKKRTVDYFLIFLFLPFLVVDKSEMKKNKCGNSVFHTSKVLLRICRMCFLFPASNGWV